MPASYRIAVLGFPRTGKTTLITALFAYLFREGVRGASIVPRGDETIQRINADMEQLELGRPIGPTTDQDVFAYRAEVRVPSVLTSRRYKLEIGDFPGESTVTFTEQYGDWLHRTKYFEWAISADAFMFVLDTGSILSDQTGEYVARQKRAFRAAWQRLQEHYLEGSADLAKRPLILVFSKADFLLLPRSELRWPEVLKKIPSMVSVDEARIDHEALDLRSRFADLIEYFERESRRFAIVFASVFVDVDGERLGVPRIARYIMPRSTFWPVGRQGSTIPSARP
jgi:GTPase SAR1 family protein